MSPTVGHEDRPRVVPGIASVEMDGEVVLLDHRGHVHLLNPTAGLLWQCFDGHGQVGEIAADVAEAFGVPLDGVQREVVALAEDLANRGLVTLGPEADEAPGAEPVADDSPFVVQPRGY